MEKINVDIMKILEKYSHDNDIMDLLSQKSHLHRKINILETKVEGLTKQLQGLHKFIEGKKLMEMEE